MAGPNTKKENKKQKKMARNEHTKYKQKIVHEANGKLNSKTQYNKIISCNVLIQQNYRKMEKYPKSKELYISVCIGATNNPDLKSLRSFSLSFWV